MEEYKVVWSSSILQLENEVSVYLKQGYELYEGLQYFSIQKIGGCENVFCQVLVKTKIKTKEVVLFSYCRRCDAPKDTEGDYCIACQEDLNKFPFNEHQVEE